MRPAVSPTAERLYGTLGSLTDGDESGGWLLLQLCESLVSGLEKVNFYAEETGFPGWSALLDLNRAPTEALGYLAQFKGVQLDLGLDDASQRLRIQEAAGFTRGRPTALIAAAQQRLTGTKTVYLTERWMGDPYRIRVRTYVSETPDQAAMLAALQALVPAGIILQYDDLVGMSYDERKATGLTYTALAATGKTYTQLAQEIP